MKPVEEQGYLIVACNTDTVDYVGCASLLAESVKHWHPGAKVCLLTDQAVDNSVFDYVNILSTVDQHNPYANDWQVFSHTPFRETIKLEADMLITSDIQHWWNMFRHRDLVVSTGCRDWQDRTSTARNYRKIFDDNNLPDVYNAITYWRLSETAKEFFSLVRNIFDHWAEFQTLLKFPEAVPSTDVVYAMAAQIIGPEQVTLPFASYPRMVHMKQHIAKTETTDWTRELVWEYHNHQLRIDTVAQWGAFHYNTKTWRP